MCELAEVERTWQRGEVEKVIEILLSRSTDTFPRIIYIAFGDISQYYHTTYSRQWPEHKRNTKLDLLYAWLTSVGYVMSDEEKAMQDGTHELFRRGQRE